MIENRNVKPGTVLVKRYKKRDFRCEVVKGEGGKLVYRVGRKEYASPSAAGSAVMGGVACNGWVWWTVEGKEKPRASMKAKTETKATTRAVKVKTAPGKVKRATRVKPVAGGANGEEPTPTEKPVNCGDCGQKFPTSREAAEHMQQAHTSPEASGVGTR